MHTNFIGATFFEQVKLLFNNVLVYDSYYYAHKAYIQTLLGENEETKNGYLTAAGWCDLENGEVNRILKQDKEIDICVPLLFEPFQTERLLVPHINIQLSLYRNKDDFCLEAAKSTKAKLEISDLRLHMRAIDVVSSAAIALENKLRTTPAQYPFTVSKVKMISIPEGRFELPFNTLYHDIIPRRVIIGLVSSKTDVTKNSLYFDHFNVSEIQLDAGGKMYPSQPIQCDFKNKFYATAFTRLFEELGAVSNKTTPKISYKMYRTGCTFFVFNLSPLDSSNSWELMKSGSTQLLIRFADKTPKEGINVLVLSQFDGIMNKELKKFMSREPIDHFPMNSSAPSNKFPNPAEIQRNVSISCVSHSLHQLLFAQESSENKSIEEEGRASISTLDDVTMKDLKANVSFSGVSPALQEVLSDLFKKPRGSAKLPEGSVAGSSETLQETLKDVLIKPENTSKVLEKSEVSIDNKTISIKEISTEEKGNGSAPLQEALSDLFKKPGASFKLPEEANDSVAGSSVILQKTVKDVLIKPEKTSELLEKSEVSIDKKTETIETVSMKRVTRKRVSWKDCEPSSSRKISLDDQNIEVSKKSDLSCSEKENGPVAGSSEILQETLKDVLIKPEIAAKLPKEEGRSVLVSATLQEALSVLFEEPSSNLPEEENGSVPGSSVILQDTLTDVLIKPEITSKLLEQSEVSIDKKTDSPSETIDSIKEEKRALRKRVSWKEPEPSSSRKISLDEQNIETPRKSSNSTIISPKNFSSFDSFDLSVTSLTENCAKEVESSTTPIDSERRGRKRAHSQISEEIAALCKVSKVKIKWEPMDEEEEKMNVMETRSGRRIETRKRLSYPDGIAHCKKKLSIESFGEKKKEDESMKTRSGRRVSSPFHKNGFRIETQIIENNEHPFTYKMKGRPPIPPRNGKIEPESASRSIEHDFRISGMIENTEKLNTAAMAIEGLINASEPTSSLRKYPHFYVKFTGVDNNTLELMQLKTYGEEINETLPESSTDTDASRILKGILLLFLELDLNALQDLRMEMEGSMNEARESNISIREIEKILEECVNQVIEDSEISSKEASIGLGYLLDRLNTSIRWIPGLDGFQRKLRKIIKDQKEKEEEKDVAVDNLKTALETAVAKFF
uniref:SPK domain-containing protein n=2 Tax=Caenorhabditis tropicalis TaxID=1561998 RepID=A0A1I7U807_9PELO